MNTDIAEEEMIVILKICTPHFIALTALHMHLPPKGWTASTKSDILRRATRVGNAPNVHLSAVKSSSFFGLQRDNGIQTLRQIIRPSVNFIIFFVYPKTTTSIGDQSIMTLTTWSNIWIQRFDAF